MRIARSEVVAHSAQHAGMPASERSTAAAVHGSYGMVAVNNYRW